MQPPIQPQQQNNIEQQPAYANIAGYKFVTLEQLAELRPHYQSICSTLNLRGTILLAPEGINLVLSALPQQITAFVEWLRSDIRFSDMVLKWSYSETVAFKRMRVRLKKEIITMRHPLIKPEDGRAPVVDAVTLKRWLDRGQDDTGRPLVLIDTRNDFEVDVGTFEGALDYRIEQFSQFPEVAAAHKDQLHDATVVTFCTGGIRCEKAAIYMKSIGYQYVFQLDGGILKYFEEVGSSHYRGDCFVFDERIALNSQLEPAHGQYPVDYERIAPNDE
jgi:UPF0176 protein